MRPLSVRFKREIVSVGIFAPWLAIYLPFEDETWSLYATLCVSYTVLVFGLLWSDGRWRKYIETGQRTARDLVRGHAVFVLVMILWIWICKFSRPWLPDWMFGELYRDLNFYLIFSGLGIVAIWWAEQSWLAKPLKKDERMGVLPQ